MRKILSIAIVLIAGTAAFAQEACYKDYEKAVASISASTDPELKATAALIKKLQDNGLDPAKYIVDFEGQLVPVVVKFYTLAERKRDAIQKESKTSEACAKDVMPLRALSDLVILYKTMGLSLLVPDQVTRIDWAEIVKKGKPLGGDDALIPKARDQALNALGIGGDVGMIIKDPKCVFGGCR